MRDVISCDQLDSKFGGMTSTGCSVLACADRFESKQKFQWKIS